jgi:hypothetical protein
MSLSYSPKIDDLLADSLIQAVMRADHVEPRELKTLLYRVAGRIGGAEHVLQRPAAVFVSSAKRSWTPCRSRNTTSPRKARGVRDPSYGSALCC